MNPFNMDLNDNPANDCEYLVATHARLLGLRSDPEPSDDPDYLDHQAAMRQARIDSDNLPGISAAQLAERLQEVNKRNALMERYLVRQDAFFTGPMFKRHI
tara:strand:+ start:44 stop:346 length:303 start_codon:yes stop_codon:yes gene_type:complete